MKAEHLLEDDKNELSQVETTAHTGKQIPNESISFKKCESSGGSIFSFSCSWHDFYKLVFFKCFSLSLAILFDL